MDPWKFRDCALQSLVLLFPDFFSSVLSSAPPSATYDLSSSIAQSHAQSLQRQFLAWTEVGVWKPCSFLSLRFCTYGFFYLGVSPLSTGPFSSGNFKLRKLPELGPDRFMRLFCTGCVKLTWPFGRDSAPNNPELDTNNTTVTSLTPLSFCTRFITQDKVKESASTQQTAIAFVSCAFRSFVDGHKNFTIHLSKGRIAPHCNAVTS